ncbi:LAFA_0F02124g1_1 [Lachancea sp. 'fantastica']|nr:LAFA_0F02124g1_1 [Lachancea sp. 'fantastica']
MPIKLKWPWLGIAIPSFLISYIGYTSHYFILSNFASQRQQLTFQFSLSMVWVSYILAIYVNPGNPPKGFSPNKQQWTHFCKICNNYKPERSHHCKTCGKCILMMDHHCPWTMNCVGYRNFPHFIKFLVWIIVTALFLEYLLIKRVVSHWQARNERIFVHPAELWFLVVNLLLNSFICLSISLLLARCANNQLLDGMTQIEKWEMERIENLFYRKRLLPQLIDNLKIIFGEQSSTEASNQNLLSKKRLRLEEVVNFPYDLGISANLKTCMGPLKTWILPWASPSGSGCIFEVNDLALYEPDAALEDKLMALPWPPDGGRQICTGTPKSSPGVPIHTSRGETVLKKRIPDATPSSSGKYWQNEWGESLADFGVDVDAEA